MRICARLLQPAVKVRVRVRVWARLLQPVAPLLGVDRAADAIEVGLAQLEARNLVRVRVRVRVRVGVRGRGRCGEGGRGTEALGCGVGGERR